MDRLPEDMRVDSIRNPRFKNVNEVLRGYINAQRLIGKRGVFVPTEQSPPEEVAEYRKAVGVPETLEGYEAKPAQLPEGVEWDDNYAKPFLEIGQKYHISKEAMQKLIGAHIAQEQLRSAATVQVIRQEAEQRYKEGYAKLEQAWGKDIDNNTRRIKAAAERLGCPLNTPGFNDPEMCKFVNLLIEQTREDQAIMPGGGTNGRAAGMTPGEQADDIQQNSSNPEHAAYHGIGREINPAVQAKVRNLRIAEERRLNALRGGA